MLRRQLAISAFYLGLCIAFVGRASERPFCRTELLFPLETPHNHGSCIVELPNRDLLVCWFHGSGERKVEADDVKIEGARLHNGKWGPRFTMADTLEFPDGNPCMLVDSQQRLWLFYTTILANTWESALLKVRVSRDYRSAGAPHWESSEVLHVKPGPEFEAEVKRRLTGIEDGFKAVALTDKDRQEVDQTFAAIRDHAEDKLYQRLGWMTRAHPLQLRDNRIIVPLYHDGFSFSLNIFSDDWGNTWRATEPLVGPGNIQPSIVQRRDGSLYALMRHNGPPPHRLQASDSMVDHGETWSAVQFTDLPNPGSGAEIISLRNGHWVLISNDTTKDRERLAVQISDDEGRTWKWKRYLERDSPGPEAGRYHYPSIVQSMDGTLHASYSYHLNAKALPRDVNGHPAAKSIKHAHFNEAWVMENGVQAVSGANN